MGNASSQMEMDAIEDQGQNTERRRKKRKHSKHAVVDGFDQENAQDNPSQLDDSSMRHKSKRRKNGKRRKKTSKLNPEHSKEEESARTLLEMKGAAALSNFEEEEEEEEDELAQVTASRENGDRSAPSNMYSHGRERHRKKRSSHKNEKRRRRHEEYPDEQNVAVPVGNSSTDCVVAPMGELLSTVYPEPTDEHSQSFRPVPDRGPLSRFTPPQRTVQDATMTHTYSEVPAYADPDYRPSTPPYNPEATPPPLHSTESQRRPPNSTPFHGNKRKSSQQQDLGPQDSSTATAYGRGGKRRGLPDSTEAHISAALADAATAANALIDPVLTGQPPLWTIIDGKTAYMGKIINPGPGKKISRKDKISQTTGSKRKRRLPVDNLYEDETPAVVQKPKKRTKKLGAPEMPIAADGIPAGGQPAMTKGGPFSDLEENLLKQFMEGYRLEHGLTEYELNSRVWAERRLNRDDFWDQVSAVIPYRPRQSIYKYCRRQFHNFPKRGQWTLEEDEELAVATKEHPQQWKTVGSLLNRMPEDCRDRWRNYLKCGEARNKDVWTEQEENRLKQHVREVIAALGKEKGNAPASGENVMSDEDVDKKASLINWTVISEKMGGTRSRIQCSYKWKKLQRMAAREQEQAKTNGNQVEADPQPKKTWRAKRAEGNFFKMLPGDKYDLLKASLTNALATRLKDSGTYEEKNIPWKLVGSPEFCRTWNLTDRKTAFKFLKQTVPNHESMTLQDIVSELLKELDQLPQNLLSLHYVAPQVSPKQSKRSRNLSSEVVVDETGEEDVGYHQDSSHDSYDHQEGRRVVDQELGSQSGDYPRQLSMEEDRYLGEEVDERMAQQVQLLRHV
ncbi:hypothetical protein FGG08_003486 [Glutinoglossum americanum]|uniref:DNA-binding protein REB1 n=1 Tax=Glutinoglossum americanum TaxID=1670608 RepID=A0A9P8I2L6_9PEZI|nr:hypothetical protein FGG08_003486 [Glutinoglossum americanum]